MFFIVAVLKLGCLKLRDKCFISGALIAMLNTVVLWEFVEVFEDKAAFSGF